MASASFTLGFLIFTWIVKKLLKSTTDKKKNRNKIVILARRKINSIESKISEAFINNEISHENFITIINKMKNYQELQKSIRMMNSHRSDTEKIIWLKKVKK